MATREFALPDVGEGVAEGQVVEWLVAPGDAVSEDQPVAEVETDKAVVEVPSPVTGTVEAIHAEAGETVPVGTVIITFELAEDEAAPATEAAEAGGTATGGDGADGDQGGREQVAVDEGGETQDGAERERSGEQPTEQQAGTGSEPTERVERVPYSGIRRTIGEAMQRSVSTAPHATHHDEIDVTGLVETRAELKPRAQERGVDLPFTPFMIAAAVAALEEHPSFNARLDEAAGEIVQETAYNVGFGVATDHGLLVPVVEHADRMGLFELARAVNELADKARRRTITREEMQAGTFTVTNIGGMSGEYATPIINYPEASILGLGTIEQRPVVDDRSVVARYTLPISVSYDHRLNDPEGAARFVNTVGEFLSEPRWSLLD